MTRVNASDMNFTSHIYFETMNSQLAAMMFTSFGDSPRIGPQNLDHARLSFIVFRLL